MIQHRVTLFLNLRKLPRILLKFPVVLLGKRQFKELFGPKQNPIKRVGIITFESMIQPTWNGIAAHDKIYLSKSGKQLLTEELLKIWDEALSYIKF